MLFLFEQWTISVKKSATSQVLSGWFPFPFLDLIQFPIEYFSYGPHFLPMQQCECIFIVSMLLKSGSELTDSNQEAVR